MAPAAGSLWRIDDAAGDALTTHTNRIYQHIIFILADHNGGSAWAGQTVLSPGFQRELVYRDVELEKAVLSHGHLAKVGCIDVVIVILKAAWNRRWVKRSPADSNAVPSTGSQMPTP